MSLTIRKIDEGEPLYGRIRKPSKWACLVKGHIWRLLDAGNFRMCDRCRQHQLRFPIRPGLNQWRNV